MRIAEAGIVGSLSKLLGNYVHIEKLCEIKQQAGKRWTRRKSEKEKKFFLGLIGFSRSLRRDNMSSTCCAFLRIFLKGRWFCFEASKRNPWPVHDRSQSLSGENEKDDDATYGILVTGVNRPSNVVSWQERNMFYCRRIFRTWGIWCHYDWLEFCGKELIENPISLNDEKEKLFLLVCNWHIALSKQGS